LSEQGKSLTNFTIVSDKVLQECTEPL